VPDRFRVFSPSLRPGGVPSRSLREETPLRELTSLVTATLGGKSRRRWAWLFSPLNSTGSHSKSAQTDRMISSMRTR
jgi:hypothetical protein